MMDEIFLSKQTASDMCTYCCRFIITVIIVIELLPLKIVGDTPDVSTVFLMLL
jgi:hypothetical protein